MSKLGKVLDRFVPNSLQPLWNHPAGPQTIFFWAPAVKWGLVLAGLGDLNRPVENVSLKQCGSLTATAIVWSRFSMVIVPKNWSLFAVNVLIFLTSGYQVMRAVRFQMSDTESKDPKNKK
ncbi:mitochondrial pyruvate carrier 2 [Halyomorpha halys]|uniref:mitochondrial pyruvate carrier 2 n=1 Tax=Halyomorpha halys TaxID=286706 RepID=UPI0006D51678|nr:mitochondrial pyruvate carrier 2-like [Halyomorpha halys]